MRLNVFLAIGLGLGLGPACLAADDASFKTDRELIARFHFIGAGRVETDPNAASLNAMAVLPETVVLKERTLQKLATAPYRYLRDHAAGTNDFAPLIRPLLDDLLRAESFIEVRGPTNEVPELMLAIRLNQDHAGIWRSNLTEILTTWTGLPVKEIKAEGFEGWELRKHHQPDCLRFFQAGDWVLFGWGQEDIHGQTGMLRRLRDKKPPVEVSGNAWLDLQIDWSRLAGKPPALGPYNLVSTHLLVEGTKAFVRPQLTMQFAEPLGLSLKPWRIPTNIIHNPIVSFTAVRGVLPRLSDLPSVKALNASPLPDQCFVWATSQIPFETCLAATVANATNYLERIAPGLVSLFNDKVPPVISSIRAEQTNGQIVIPGLPIVSPYVRAIHEASGDYLLAGLLASPRRDQPLPATLIDMLTQHPNLVAYDWELTGSRLPQWRSVDQIVFIVYKIHVPAPDAPAQKWIDSVGPKLVNCGTEVTLTAPNELTLVRNSVTGFSSLEIFWLAHWLDSPGFPLGAYGETARWHPAPGTPAHEP